MRAGRLAEITARQEVDLVSRPVYRNGRGKWSKQVILFNVPVRVSV